MVIFHRRRGVRTYVVESIEAPNSLDVAEAVGENLEDPEHELVEFYHIKSIVNMDQWNKLKEQRTCPRQP